MSDFQKYKAKRMNKNSEFWNGYEKRYKTFKSSQNQFFPSNGLILSSQK